MKPRNFVAKYAQRSGAGQHRRTRNIAYNYEKGIDMAEKIAVKGITREEAVAKAEEVIKTIDPYRSPHLEGTWKKDDNEWIAYVKYWGLD